jgi:hypothetical protein
MPMTGSRWRNERLALAALAAGLWLGVGSTDARAVEPEPTAAARVYLIGDAGDPDPRGEPVLRALRAELERATGPALVVFLGDNVYPNGMPAAGDAQRSEMERRIRDQIESVRGTGARLVFLPGNHDWERGGADGWDAVRREAQVVAAVLGSADAYLPRDGCPGPEVFDFGARLRVVVLDTQWWLHGGPKPQHPTSTCAADNEAEVLAALDEALAGAGSREVLIAAHHPLDTAGEHGGHFGFEDHVFPLRRLRSWLWLPLPLVGSAYPLSRQAGITDQDLTSAAYRRMIEAFDAVLRPRRPLVWAAGHDHNLQLLRHDSARHVIVSGAGIFGHTQPMRKAPALVWNSDAAGFMRLHVAANGPVRLTALAVDRSGSAREVFSAPLE